MEARVFSVFVLLVAAGAQAESMNTIVTTNRHKDTMRWRALALEYEMKISYLERALAQEESKLRIAEQVNGGFLYYCGIRRVFVYPRDYRCSGGVAHPQRTVIEAHKRNNTPVQRSGQRPNPLKRFGHGFECDR